MIEPRRTAKYPQHEEHEAGSGEWTWTGSGSEDEVYVVGIEPSEEMARLSGIVLLDQWAPAINRLWAADRAHALVQFGSVSSGVLPLQPLEATVAGLVHQFAELQGRFDVVCEENADLRRRVLTRMESGLAQNQKEDTEPQTVRGLHESTEFPQESLDSTQAIISDTSAGLKEAPRGVPLGKPGFLLRRSG